MQMRIVLLFGLMSAGVAWCQKVPVVVELFTSEGCSSCPPADDLLTALDREQPVPGVQLIVLSEHVDYWNSEGWVDPYSAHEFSERQQRYVEFLHAADSYTPQAVIDGRLETVGNNTAKVGDAIEKAKREKKVPLTLKVSPGEKGLHVEVSAGEKVPNHAEIFIAIAEDSVTTKVSAGENGGRVLTETAVVRSLTKAGKLANDSTAMAADLKMNPHWGKHLRVVAFVADRECGKILGAAEMKL